VGILLDKVYKTCITDLNNLNNSHNDLNDIPTYKLSGLSWITPSLQLLRISGVVVSQGASRPAAVILSTVFDFDILFSAITTTFLTVVDQSNTCTQIAMPVWFNYSCQL